eukprot:jgi/Bigna1/133629/aug1.22_g8337
MRSSIKVEIATICKVRQPKNAEIFRNSPLKLPGFGGMATMGEEERGLQSIGEEIMREQRNAQAAHGVKDEAALAMPPGNEIIDSLIDGVTSKHEYQADIQRFRSQDTKVEKERGICDAKDYYDEKDRLDLVYKAAWGNPA